MRNTVNSWGTNPQISSISLFHRPRNPVKINSEARLVWFVLTKVPEMDTQLFSLLFGNTPIKCHGYFAKNRGGWDYVARRWSQVRVPFLAAFPSTHAWSLPLPHTHTQTHCAQHLLMRHSTGKSLATTVLSSIYISVPGLFHVTLGAETIISRCVTTELSTLPGVWYTPGNYVLQECEEGTNAKKALQSTKGMF